MVQRSTEELVIILRKTLKDVQESVWRDTTATTEMKRAILRAIVELESEVAQSTHQRNLRTPR